MSRMFLSILCALAGYINAVNAGVMLMAHAYPGAALSAVLGIIMLTFAAYWLQLASRDRE